MYRKFKNNGWEIIALGRREFALQTEELAKRLQGVIKALGRGMSRPTICPPWPRRFPDLQY